MSWSYWRKRLAAASWVWLLGLLIVVAAVVGFRWLAGEVLERETFSWDTSILLFAHNMHRPWLDSVMTSLTYIGLPGGAIITLLVCIGLWTQRQHSAAVALAASFIGAFLLYTVLKLIFTRTRPDLFTDIILPTDYSFPSGHALTALTLYSFIALLLLEHRHYLWAVLALLFALLICFSRIYLGVHFPSDILGALA